MDFSQLIVFLNEYFRVLILTAGFCITLFFAYQKVTNKITAEIKISFGPFTEEYISSVILINKKDKVVSVWAVYVVFEKDISLKLDSFDPPIIIKPYETISLTFPKYSSLSINNCPHEPDFYSETQDLYIDIGQKFIKCERQIKTNSLKIFTPIFKSIKTFNGHVFNEQVAYFISYIYEDKYHTAFVSESGYISNEWGFFPNHFGSNEITPESIDYFMKQNHFDKIFSSCIVYKVNYPNYQIFFPKPT